ncbi:MAG: hypothetical protein AB8C13_02865 [Phycisphaerales bacterium]
MHTTHHTFQRIGLALVLTTFAGSTLAQQADSDADLLKGPSIVENSGPEDGNTMTGTADASKRAGDMPLRAYIGAIRGLEKASEENPELALTPDQEEQIKEIGRVHAEQMRAFMQEHKEELAEFRGQSGMRGERGDRARNQDRGARGQRQDDATMQDQDRPRQRAGNRQDQQSDLSPEQQQRNREGLAEIMANAPSDQSAKTEIWTVLTEDQQTFVKERISQMRTQRQDRVDQALQKGKEGKEAKEGKQRKGKDNVKGKRGDKADP